MSLFKPSSSIVPASLHDKILFWGPQHTGKTHVSLGWPGPLVVDVEQRAAHFSDRFQFLLAECRSIEEIAGALREIQKGDLPCESIIVDSATAIYYKFVELYTSLNNDGKPITDWVAVNRRMLAFINFTFGIAGKNVIFTAHAGEKLVRQGRDFTKAGLQFVGDQKFRFAFDYVFRLEPTGADPRRSPVTFHVEKSASPNLTVGQAIKGLDYAKFLELTRGKTQPKNEPAPLKGEALADAQARGDVPAQALPEGMRKTIEAIIERDRIDQIAVVAIVKDCTKNRTVLYNDASPEEGAQIVKRLQQLRREAVAS